MKRLISVVTAVALGLVLLTSTLGASAAGTPPTFKTTTPIKHIVVIFQENVSFDHYFGTYPNALNPSGEPKFTASSNTPSVNGLTPALLTNNPNLANPFRLDRSQALTCDQNHSYLAEQQSFNHGLMDQFVQDVSGGSCINKDTVMGYFDGNTVTDQSSILRFIKDNWNVGRIGDQSFDALAGSLNNLFNFSSLQPY